MEAAVTWLVLWTVTAFVVAPIAGWVVGFLGAAIALDNNSEGGALIAMIVGWLLGGVFFVFSLIQAIIQLVSVIQLATAGAA